MAFNKRTKTARCVPKKHVVEGHLTDHSLIGRSEFSFYDWYTFSPLSACVRACVCLPKYLFKNRNCSNFYSIALYITQLYFTLLDFLADMEQHWVRQSEKSIRTNKRNRHRAKEKRNKQFVCVVQSTFYRQTFRWIDNFQNENAIIPITPCVLQ